MKKRMRISAYKKLEDGRRKYEDIMEIEVKNGFTRKDGKFLANINFFLNYMIDNWAAKENHVVEIKVEVQAKNLRFGSEEEAERVDNALGEMGVL